MFLYKKKRTHLSERILGMTQEEVGSGQQAFEGDIRERDRNNRKNHVIASTRHIMID